MISIASLTQEALIMAGSDCSVDKGLAAHIPMEMAGQWHTPVVLHQEAGTREPGRLASQPVQSMSFRFSETLSHNTQVENDRKTETDLYSQPIQTHMHTLHIQEGQQLPGPLTTQPKY